MIVVKAYESVPDGVVVGSDVLIELRSVCHEFWKCAFESFLFFLVIVSVFVEVDDFAACVFYLLREHEFFDLFPRCWDSIFEVRRKCELRENLFFHGCKTLARLREEQKNKLPEVGSGCR